MIGIYKIECKINNKVYVGSSVDVELRMRKHKERLNRGTHHSPYLQSCWNKYGEGEFTFSVLEEIDARDRETIIEAEQKWMDHFISYDRANGFNVCPQAKSRLGSPVSPETRKKISAANTGENHPLWGVSLTEEHRQKISQSNKGKKAWNKGVKMPPLSEEQKQKMSAALKGRKLSQEQKEQISKTLMGHEVSEEARQKLREANLGKKLTAETKAKIGAKSRGELSGTAKLTWEIVREIRTKYSSGEYSQSRLAREYGVSQGTIWSVVLKKSWIELDEDAK